MIEFLINAWWIYVPIILVLLFLIRRNNKKIEYIKAEREIRKLPSEEQMAKLAELRHKQSGHGLRNVLGYIFPKK